MTVETIPRCVCADHDPTAADSCEYGMPILIPHTLNNGKYLWNIKCPNCGRGGLYEEKSVYYALNKWNELQKVLYQWKAEGLLQ